MNNLFPDDLSITVLSKVVAIKHHPSPISAEFDSSVTFDVRCRDREAKVLVLNGAKVYERLRGHWAKLFERLGVDKLTAHVTLAHARLIKMMTKGEVNLEIVKESHKVNTETLYAIELVLTSSH